jgi:virginiamycin B lyase
MTAGRLEAHGKQGGHMTHSSTKLCSSLCSVILGLLGLAFSAQRIEAREIANPASNGTISGTVSADQGEVRAFRVKAKDTVHLITYVVFTNKGKYHIYNLPPSTYQIQVMERGFDSLAQSVELKAAETKTVDVALKAKAERERKVKIVDFDTLYPPGKGRDLLQLNCWGCHGVNGGIAYHQLPKRTEDEWAAAVKRMFRVEPAVWPSPTWPSVSAGNAGGYNGANVITAEEKQTIVKYLAANFGPESETRDLKYDTLVREEEALSKAVWIQYELPPVDESKSNGLSLTRGTHDVTPSHDPRWRGMVWLTEPASNSILALDTTDLDPKTRNKEWMIRDSRANFNAGPNSIVERNGHIYWAELKGDSIGDINEQTGEMNRYLAPTPSQTMHGIIADSLGNVWYASLGGGIVGRMDIETKKFTEWQPGNGLGTYYGMRVDKKNRIWAASVARRMVAMWDPKAEKWTTYTTPDNIRRLTVDSKGRVWMNEYFANAVTMLDPETKQMTEYKLPLKWGNPYESCADLNDNIWLENAAYQSLVKFDPQSKSFTYFPYPEMNAHTPKMEVDDEGTLWSGLTGPGQPKQLTSFKLNGNVPMKDGTMAGKK